jgi:hypothetical protein
MINESWQEQRDAARQAETDPTVCFCDCHFYPAIQHIAPCCRPCEKCGKRILAEHRRGGSEGPRHSDYCTGGKAKESSQER